MTRRLPLETRVLAVDPAHRGLGYALIERGPRVLDWGVREVRHGEKNRRGLSRVEELIARYEPHVLVIEDCAAKGSRRRPRIERLIAAIERLAAANRIEVRKIARATIEEAFSQTDATNKQEIATAIARSFPQLAVWLPPARKLWMSENCRTDIFDAAALGLTFFYLEEGSMSAS